MRRKPAFNASRSASRFLGVGVAAASWVLSVTVMQAVAGTEIRRGARQLEQRIELQLQLKGGHAPVRGGERRERTHEESIEPWELVSV
jgi:hypothetical protein